MFFYQIADNFGVFGWIDYAQPIVDIFFILSVMLSGFILILDTLIGKSIVFLFSLW